MREGEIITDPAVDSLLARIRLVVREELAARADVDASNQPLDPLKPLSAEELCVRWGIMATSAKLRLHRLAYLCRRRGLVAAAGTRGAKKRFALPDVIAAEKRAGIWRAAA